MCSRSLLSTSNQSVSMISITLFGLLFQLLGFFTPRTNAQLPVIGDQPYLRGVISALPLANSQGEFLPPPQDNTPLSPRPTVTIADGTLRGFTMRTVNGRAISAFQSIPFAQPPVGPLRFRDPVKNSPWNGTLNAVPQSPQCIQLDFVRFFEVHGQEDCMYLNVYVPQTPLNTSLPVMVWIHGGGFFFGAGSIYGPRYLLDRDVILVTINYRLGPFGFFSTGDMASPGNQGMKDQVLALKWVQQNIASFGGNPDSVTIFGESAGAGAVGLHMVSPLSRGLFHRGISESGAGTCYWADMRNVSQTARRVGDVFKCPTTSSEEMVECLRNVPEKLLAPVQLSFIEWFVFPLVIFAPTAEEPDYPGAFMTKSVDQYYADGEAVDVPWIAGMNQNELSWFMAALIQDPIHVHDINTDWDRVGPIFMSLNYNTTEVNIERIRKVWDFYMGDNKLSWETRHDFGRLFGDRYLTEGILEAMRYHSMYTNQSVYAYHFSYEGRFSSVQQFGQKPENWGVAHLDDLIYLLNNPDYYQTLNPGDPELEMSRMFTSIWANFATHGIPYIPGGNGTLLDTWEPIPKATDKFSPLRLLDLNLSPQMMEDRYVDRYNFWRREIDPNP